MLMRICISLLFLVILACIVPASALMQPPVANFTVDSTTGYALNPIHFTDTSTGNPVSWYWSFGDGESSTLQNPEHSYTSLSGGVYTISLKVTNAYGSNISELKKIYMADYTQVVTTVAAHQITAPYTITSPGTYTLGSDCKGKGNSGDCSITITAPYVTLDGGGHTLIDGGIIVKKPGATRLDGVTIRNLWIEGGTTGILLSGTHDTTIRDVTVVETVFDGMIIEDSERVLVADSRFLKNVDYISDPAYENVYHGGILLTGTDNVDITRCTFEDHANAIVLRYATDTTISSNYFHNNRDVMYHSAKGTKIFNNYISVVDVAPGTTSNTLNNNTLTSGVKNIIGGNRMGGNYWYQDNGKGYSQTCMDEKHSGICDKPYEIDYPSGLDKAMRTDNFPLSGPVASGKPAHTVITPKAVHTLPTGAVYNQISPTQTVQKPVTTPSKASLPSSLAILAILFGALVAYCRH